MAGILLDTHVWAWSLNRDWRLSARAAAAIEQADPVLVSPISFFEIGLKVASGRWPEMEALVPQLSDLLAAQDGKVSSLTPEVALLAASLEWQHRDPFDRMIAATAIRSSCVLVSADAAFDGLTAQPDWPGRLW